MASWCLLCFSPHDSSQNWRRWHDIIIASSAFYVSLQISPNIIIVYRVGHSQRFDIYTNHHYLYHLYQCWGQPPGQTVRLRPDFLRGTNKMSSLWLHVLLLDLFLMMVFCYKRHVILSINVLCYFGEIRAERNHSVITPREIRESNIASWKIRKIGKYLGVENEKNVIWKLERMDKPS